jgi:hypothetical protein
VSSTITALSTLTAIISLSGRSDLSSLRSGCSLDPGQARLLVLCKVGGRAVHPATFVAARHRTAWALLLVRLQLLNVVDLVAIYAPDIQLSDYIPRDSVRPELTELSSAGWAACIPTAADNVLYACLAEGVTLGTA